MSPKQTLSALTIRGVDETVKSRLKARADLNERSMEAEVRYILAEAVRPVNVGQEMQDLARRFGGLDDLAAILEESTALRREAGE